MTAEEARRFGLPCGGELEVIIEPEVARRRDSRRCSPRSRRAASSRAAWTSRPALDARARDGRATNASAPTTRFTSVHGPRWRMLIIGASEIAHYLAEVASTVDFQVFVCDPREEYKTAWRAHGAHWVDGMPDDAVLAFKPDGHSVILTVSHDPKLDDMALLEALKSDAFYVGAVGSGRTSAERRKRLADFDLTPQQIARLRGPVGLDDRLAHAAGDRALDPRRPRSPRATASCSRRRRASASGVSRMKRRARCAVSLRARRIRRRVAAASRNRFPHRTVTLVVPYCARRPARHGRARRRPEALARSGASRW